MDGRSEDKDEAAWSKEEGEKEEVRCEVLHSTEKLKKKFENGLGKLSKMGLVAVRVCEGKRTKPQAFRPQKSER